MNDREADADAAEQIDGVPVREIDAAEALKIAVDLQRHDHFEQAEQIYRALLANRPDDPDALNLFGVLRHQQGRSGEALNYIARAIREIPDAPGPWLNLGSVLLESGRFDEAGDAWRRVVELSPDSAGVYNNLGVLQMKLGRLDEAERCFASAIEREPGMDFAHENFANLCFRTGRYDEAIDHSLRALGLDGRQGGARWLLCLAMFRNGQTEQALSNLRHWAASEPDNPRPRHHLAALGELATPTRAPDDYVQQVFDGFAESFDAKLEHLGYRAPQLVEAALLGLGERLPRDAEILDAGCGTGLCGPLLRPLGSRLTGVDLSPRMLEQARKRHVYDELQQAELTDYIGRADGRFGIVASADTLCYFGDLDPVLAATRRALQPGGVLAASVEALLDADDDFRLQLNGRYAQSEAYVRAALQRNGLRLESFERHVLRQEGGADVDGWVFAATRADPA